MLTGLRWLLMPETLQAMTQQGVIGTVTLDGQKLAGSTPALQNITASWLKRKGSAQAAFTAMDGWSNGYLEFTRPDGTAGHTASLARPYERTEHGRPEHVRGYVSRQPHGWIPEAKWLEGQREWVAKGEAAWAVRAEAGRTVAERSARAREHVAGLVEGGMPAVRHRAWKQPPASPGSLATARQMMQPGGGTPEQLEAVTQAFAENLDHVPAQMREAMGRTWKIRLSPQEDMADAQGNTDGTLGLTGAFHGKWEIRIAQMVMTPATDQTVTEMEGDGRFVAIAGGDQGRALRHVVTHEFGHALFMQGQISRGDAFIPPGADDAAATGEFGVAAEAITAQLLSDLSGQPAPENGYSEKYLRYISAALHSLSEYGASEPQEAMAEAWTGYALHGHGANGSAKVRKAGEDFLREAEQEFARSQEGRGMQLNLAAAGGGHRFGCSGFPGSPEVFARRFGTPEAKQAAARAWGASGVLELARPYHRLERGRMEQVRGYVTRPAITGKGWIPEQDWLRGRQIWEHRGEAAWKVKGAAAEAREDAARAGTGYTPLDDAEFRERQKHVERTLAQAFRQGLETHLVNTVNHDGMTYTPARAAMHKKIIQDVLKEAQDIPREHKAFMTGGLPGAGKSSSLAKVLGKDVGKYYTISPDDFKAAIYHKGGYTPPAGLSPEEASTLASQEAMDLAELARHTLQAQGTNLIWDATMAQSEKVKNRVADFHKAGYSVHAVFVHVPLGTAIERAAARYRYGLEQGRQGKGGGGRNVPASDMKRFYALHSKNLSRPEHSFLGALGVFDAWDEFDNSAPGKPPQLIRSSKDAAG